MALRVLVCVKRVPAPGARIVLTPDAKGIDTANLGFTMSPHEECAVEGGLQLTEKHGGTVTVMAVGPAESDEQIRFGISVGAQFGVLVTHSSLVGNADWDAQATSRAIAESISSLEAADGPFDLILFGNESADTGGFQVGIRVARAIGRPIVNGIKGIDIDGTTVAARRESTGGFEVYNLSMPAVLGVKEGLNLPRYPTLPGRLKSKKAPVAVQEAQFVEGGLRTATFANPEEKVTQTTLLGNGADAAPAIVDLLEELGLL